jgi:2,3-bisphosphoglycerate-dependent phosphoglycerate mutase
MAVLYLVRHAHADWTPDENRPLSQQGSADSLRVADILQAHPIAAVYSSTAHRALQTVAPLAARCGLTVQTIADLRERELAAAPVADFLAAVRMTWQNPGFAFPGGESNVAAQQRGVEVIRTLAWRYPAGQLVVSTHGNLLALIVQHFQPSVGFSFWESLTMPDIYGLDIRKNAPASLQHLWPS